MLDHAFERELAGRGIPEEAELCIRSLFSPLRVNLSDSEDSIAAQWSVALANEVAAAIAAGPTRNVVFYHSRRQALMDMATSISRSDLGRAWAWRQLGLWQSKNIIASQAPFELVRALRESATLVVPILRALAQEARLAKVVGRFDETDWQDLARTALSEVGGVRLLEPVDRDTSPRALRDAWRVLNSSALLRAVTSSDSLRSASEQTRRAVAALAVIDVDPALLLSDTASTLIGIIAGAIAQTRDELDANTATTTNNSADSVAPSSKSNALDEAGAERLLGGSSTDNVSNPSAPQIADAGARASINSGSSEPNPVADHSETEVLPDQRRRGFTQFGGLLFLLAVIEDLKLPEEILGNGILTARSFTWSAHQLALSLMQMEPGDPAALAFAGLPPDAKPPSDGEDPPSENEAKIFDALAKRVVERLSSLVESDHLEEPALEFVCCRRAEIVSDPGWLEVRFALDDVSTEIRRAGLDLNPGYVAWLGLVVVFVYE